MRKILRPFLFLLVVVFLSRTSSPSPEILSVNTLTGFSFSPSYAEDLGLDPRKAYLEILNSFNFKSVRVPVYWNRVYRDGVYDFSEVDFLVGEAKRRGLEVVLSFGYRNFRWPECYAPAKVLVEDDSAFEEELFTFNQAVLGHFAPTDLIDVWQVENEPLLHFRCGRTGFENPLKAIEQIRYSDVFERPIMLTFGGLELTILPFTWELIESADIIGVSFYPRRLDPLFHRYYMETYSFGLLSPRKIWREREFVEGKGRRFWVVESQVEPWGDDPRTMSPEILKSNLELLFSFGGAERIYLWGVEWWLKEKAEGRPEVFEAAKELFSPVFN